MSSIISFLSFRIMSHGGGLFRFFFYRQELADQLSRLPMAAEVTADATADDKSKTVHNSFLERSKARHANKRKQQREENTLSGLGGETTSEMGELDTMDRRKVAHTHSPSAPHTSVHPPRAARNR